ncbi:MAG: (d)CMP kinase [Oscillospiraceae bacterium]|nr:(d)CMP kinase [Oscillospiraceae bacterium]
MTSIAIDGPAGAGKSTIAQSVARTLEFIYVDTGALYRAVGLFALQNNIPHTDDAALIPRLSEIKVELDYQDGQQLIFLNGRDVTGDIRGPEMGLIASDVSAFPAVRDFLLGLQREMTTKYNVIMDGRDIGTVVLPGAQLKIFLTATPEDRAMRRYKEFIAKGSKITYDQVLGDIQRRDANDIGRATAPLKPAQDAVMLDTTGNEFEQSVAQVLKIIRERGLA